VIIVAMELIGIYVYMLKSFRIDIELMAGTKFTLGTKLTLILFLPLSLIGLIIGLCVTTNLFVYKGKNISNWGICNCHKIIENLDSSVI